MPNDTNPWIAAHVAAETDYQDGDRALAARLVATEYADAPEPLACRCGATMFWKATIGAMKCPSCAALANSHGTFYAARREA